MLSSREILNFFVNKDVRKLLKRKGSDANETGRALEELRASLFNDFCSSENAKRLQQRLCTPSVALTFNFVIAIGIIFMNKWVLKNAGFQFPVLLSFIHYVVTLALIAILNALSLIPPSPPLWIIPSAISKILWCSLQQRENWTALALMWKTTPISLLCLLIMIPLLDPPGAFSYNWNFINTSMILISGVFGFLLQWSAALALGATSAISHVVLGQFKTCVLLLGNYYIFSSNPGTTSICGALVAISGMSFYTYLNLQNGKLKSEKGSPRKDEHQENKDSRDAFNGESI
ncbi:Nucleotide/sugar transporter family protein isoform 2 [Theobroma cacao]|uniref:Nucleotide/sugar transporter family protein isoform 2 n=1 Tax=Theobroma cacao TaxID=3641 RepID=A0A061GYB0_THECC|nr:Nucleotide/sugar transporter family protein isoform 2 [Theobroma cacao]